MTKNPSTPDSDERDWADIARHARTEGWWEWLIIAALIFEAALLWVFGCGKPLTEKLLNTIANLAIAVGVYGALRSAGRAGATVERLRRRSAKRVREANERAAEAEARAEEANKQTKELELALAKLKAPRGLSLTKIGQIGEELAEFAGTKYVIGVSFPHSELAGLRACIEEILREADWTEVECPAFIDINTMPSDDGVGISVTLDSSDMNSLLRTGQFVALVRAGMALSAALNREGVETREQVTLVPLPPGEDAIMYIMIGPKI